jgi:hypothetical protein
VVWSRRRSTRPSGLRFSRTCRPGWSAGDFDPETRPFRWTTATETFVYGTFGIVDPDRNFWIATVGGYGYGLASFPAILRP